MMNRIGPPPTREFISGLRPEETELSQQTPVEKEEVNAYDSFKAVQTKYNFAAAGLLDYMEKPPTWTGAGYPELDPKVEDWGDWSPYDEDELGNIEGYPPHLFIEARNPVQVQELKRKYDESVERDRIIEQTGDGYEIVNMVGAGIGNPLSLIPLYGFAGSSQRAASNFLKGSASVGGAEALNEYLLHKTDKTRTIEESASYILGAAAFGGIAGGLLGRNTKYTDEVISAEKKFLEENSAINKPAMNPDRAVVRDPETGKFKSVPRKLADRDGVGQITGFVPRMAAHLTPIRTLASDNPLTRTLSSLVGEQNIIGTTRSSIETLLTRMDGGLAKGIRQSRRGYIDYTKGPTNKKLSYKQWQAEIAHAMRNGDRSNVPGVEEAAKAYRGILEDLKKRAVKSGILKDEDALTKFAESYFPRVYNLGKIKGDPETFIQKMSDHFQATNPKLLPEEAFETAEGIYRDLTANHYQVGFHKSYVPKTGPLKGRTLAVPDNVLEEFLINEPESIIRQYTRHMGSRVVMNERFSSEALDDELKEIDDWWAKREVEAKKNGATDRELKKISRNRDRDALDLKIMRDRILNRYGMPEDPGGMFTRVGRTARNLNALRMLGGMTLSALPDLARPLWKHGMGTYARGFKALLTNPEFRNMAKADLQRFGVALDLVLDQRLRSIAELDYNPYGVSKFERGVEMMTQGTGHAGKLRNLEGIPDMGRASLMSYWNSSLKMLSGVMSQDGLLSKIAKPNKYAKDLAAGGIDEDMARRIGAQYKKYGGSDANLRFGNSGEWDDLRAAEAFETAILKEVDSTIVTPGVMDRPRWMSSEMGKVIGQVKSFAFASTNRQLLAGLAQKDLRVAQGILASTTMGMLSLYVKGLIAGKAIEEITGEDPMEFMWKGAVHSGSIGIGSELTGIADTITNEKSNAYATTNKVTNVLLGPSVGFIGDAIGAAYGDEGSIRRMIPYNNLFYLRKNIFDPLQQYAEESD